MKTIKLLSLLLVIVILTSMMPLATPVYGATSITFTAEELLGKPTNSSITINIVPDSTIIYHYQYGTSPGDYEFQTEDVEATGGLPSEVVISGLSPDTQYYYRMRYRTSGDSPNDWVNRAEHSFRTQRSPGSEFCFTVTSDIHENFNTSTQNAMTNILNDRPDFHIDLGDIFLLDGVNSQTTVNNEYLRYRDPLYLDKIGGSVPIFLSSGNHENEEGWNIDDSPFSIAVASIQARKAFFPTPVDDGVFYSGNTDPLPAIDETVYGDKFREDYYAWEWGDALFVVIDPFQYTMANPYGSTAGEGGDDPASGDQWNWTLGQQQYQWLKETLEGSDAKYKFVFSHNMVGGIPRGISVNPAGYVRGGAEAAAYFEWGGLNANGSDGFASKRPGWEKPIHQLFVENGVSAYFHGHDHQYVYETRDGIVYQEVPSPGMGGSGFTGIYTEGDHGDYQTIKMLSNSGHLRITVTPEEATVDYITSSNTNRVSNYTYTIEPNVGTADPVISVTGVPLGAFTSAPGTPSDPQSFTISGSNLTADITVTSTNADFQVSLSSGSGFGPSLVLSQSGGSVPATPIYVRFNREIVGASNGNISLTSAGATTRNVAVSGTATSTTLIQVTPDGAVSSGTGDANASSVSFSHTTGSGTNRLMLVGVSWNCGSTDRAISSVTFTPGSGPALTLTEVGTQQSGTQLRYAAIYSLLNPPSGATGTVTVTFSGNVSNGIVAGAANFAGVDQTNPMGVFAGAFGGASSGDPSLPSVTLNGLTGDELVFDTVFQGGSGSTQTLTTGAGQTQQWNNFVSNTRAAASTEQAESSSVTMSWTAASYGYWAIAAVPINPAADTPPSQPITFTGQEFLGRPTDTSISISVVPDADITLFYEYGTTQGGPYQSTSPVTALAGQPTVVEISGLEPDTEYYYRMQYSTNGGANWTTRDEHSFWTQRAKGSTFTFDITTDSHINIMLGNASNWNNTLDGVVQDNPDFLIDLGDTVAMDNGSTSVSTGDTAAVEQRYKDVLSYFNKVSASSPIFVVPGNHEQQEAWHLQGDLEDSLPVMGKNAEKKYFLNPVPDSFYTGDTSTLPELSGDKLKQDYYAWEWGDALFVVISPYWYTTTKPYTTTVGGGETDATGSGDRWDWTLGLEQFNWLKTTLEESNAKYKFVFSHQMIGGNSLSSPDQVNYGHGGVDSAHLVEWGGYNVDGTTWGWDTERPGWGSQPIRQMMESRGVTAFFHAHDHQFAYESLNGMVYQSVPSASFTGSFGIYTTGGNSGNTIWADSTQGPGRLRVTVSPSQTTVDFIRYNATTPAYTYNMAPTGGMTYTLTMAAEPDDAGFTTPEVGAHSFNDGSIVNISATANPGYQFDYWSGPVADPNSESTTVTMDGDRAVTAHFTTIPPNPIAYIGDIGSATSKTSGASLILTTTASVAAGDDIIVAYATDPNQNLSPISVTDSAGNIYNEVGYAVNTAELRTYILAAYNVKALPSGSTITITASASVTARAAVASVFRGLADSEVVDQTSTGENDASTSASSGTTATTTQANELLIGVVGSEGPVEDAIGAWGNEFTAGPRAGTTGGTADTNITVSMGWRIVSETGAYTASKSGMASRDHASIIATFKAEPSGPVPKITISGTPLSTFDSLTGSPSAEQNYTISGSNLTENIEITAPSPFEISTVSGTGFGTSLILPQTGGTVPVTTIYVRFNPSSEGTFSDNITHTSAGAAIENVAVSGTATSPTSTPVTPDGAVSSGTGDANASSVSFSHTTGSGTNRLMLVGVSWNCGSTDRAISSVTFTPGSGPALTLTEVGTQQSGTQLRYAAIYSLLNPPSGVTGTVTVTFSGGVSNGIVAGAANFAGVDQTDPLGVFTGASGQSTAPSVTLNGLTGDELVFDTVFQGGSDSTQTLTAGAGQTQQWNNFVSNTRAAASTEQAESSSVTMSWTAASSSYWAIGAVPINPAGDTPPENEPPAVTDIPDQTIAEGGSFATINLDDYVSDPDDADEQITWSFSGNSALSVSISADRVATISVPDADWNGSESIIFKATDPEGLSDEDSATFTATPVNDAPTISDIADQTINEDAASSAILFTIGDIDSALASLMVSGSSTNTALVPDDNLVFSGSGANRTLTITPLANQNGSTTITVNVSDGALTASDSFVLTVNAVNDAPSFTAGADQTVPMNSGAQTVTNWATNISPGPADESSQALTFIIESNSNEALFSAGPAISPGGELTYTPASGVSGSALIGVKLQDNGGTANGGTDTSPVQSFTINVVSGPASIVTRQLPDVVAQNQTFEVAITFTAPEESSPENPLNAIGISDLVPAGWTITLKSSECNPTPDLSKVENGTSAQYVWYGPYDTAVSFTAVYEVTVPADASGTYTFTDGQLIYYLGGTGPFIYQITGDAQLEVVEGAIIQGTTFNAMGEVLGGVTLTLDDGTQVVSGADGSYQLTVATPGTYTLTASKAGYLDEIIEDIEITPGESYTIDFKGNTSLIPSTLDINKFLACVNKWQVPPSDGTGLGMEKILKIINIWVTTN